MEKAIPFNDLLEAAEFLSLDEQESLIDVLNHRIAENRRREIYKDVLSARKEYKEGKVKPATPENIINDILS